MMQFVLRAGDKWPLSSLRMSHIPEQVPKFWKKSMVLPYVQRDVR